MLITYCEKCGILLVTDKDKKTGRCTECVQGRETRRSRFLRDSGRINYAVLLEAQSEWKRN